MQFLIEQDWHGKTPTRITPFEEPEKAEQALTKLDRCAYAALSLESEPANLRR